MKLLLTITTCFFCSVVFSQEHQNIEKLTRPYKLYPKKYPADSISNLVVPQYKDVMPNAFVGTLPAAKRIGNNGNSHNVYILPVDNMPLLTPDSSFHSKMPVVGMKSK